MTIRSTSGMSPSLCQTTAGAVPPILVSAAILSRSRFNPGKTTTAAFMDSPEAEGRGCRISLLGQGIHHGLVRAIYLDDELLAITPKLVGHRIIAGGDAGAGAEADGRGEFHRLGAVIARVAAHLF